MQCNYRQAGRQAGEKERKEKRREGKGRTDFTTLYHIWTCLD